MGYVITQAFVATLLFDLSMSTLPNSQPQRYHHLSEIYNPWVSSLPRRCWNSL